MKCELKLVNNGWVLEYEIDGETQTYVMEKGVDEVIAFRNFLQVVDEQLGPTTSRYSPKRIALLIVPGDKSENKWEDEDKNLIKWLYDRSVGGEGW